MENWVLRHRTRIYFAISAALLLCGAFGAVVGNAPVGTCIYACVLCMLCLAPLLWIRRINDRYALLAVFMGTYYMLFCGLSLHQTLFGTDTVTDPSDDFMTGAQCAAVLGAVLVLAGYRIGAALVSPASSATAVVRDWSNTVVLITGLGCYVLGSMAIAYYTIVVTPENSVRATQKGFLAMGPILTFLVMLGHLVQPLGLLMLAYGYARNRTLFWLSLVLALVVIQLAMGFIIDQKSFSFSAIMMVTLALTLWDSKLPKSWIAGLLAFALVAFPVFQASRVMRGVHGIDRMHAFEHIGDVFERALDSQEKLTEGRHRAQTFAERASGEATLKTIFERVGVDTPFLQGSTMVALPYAFIPRLLLPEKEDVAVGQLYNRIFQHGSKDDFTYISVSHLGEFYWNFGWPGVIGGMLLTGVILGYTGARSSLAEGRSLSRVLILLVTVNQVCFGFGGSISVSYVLWLRAIAGVALLQLMFARPSRQAGSDTGRDTSAGDLESPEFHSPVRPRLPNFL